MYCCVGMLSITGHLHLIKPDSLGWWLCERQLPSGGKNINEIMYFLSHFYEPLIDRFERTTRKITRRLLLLVGGCLLANYWSDGLA